ncbi:molybdopterin molybdotransferase MoeA [Nocardioidaceae bacterium]|nr:molybdopterin molybdotransferase MoeA [Nocardioidaceae bacterium]
MSPPPGAASVSVQQHLERALGVVEPLEPYEQPLLDALGLTVCEDVVAPVALPVFDNSSVDGYAVRLADVAEASAERPTHLPVVGEMAAGQSQVLAMTPGTAIRIMTGAPVPRGCDAVVPIEWTDEGTAEVRISQAPTRGQHVRRRGEDVEEGDLLLSDGSVLGPRQVGVVASVGRPQVLARPRPRVVVMSTGAELREPGRALAHDSIYDANSYLLAAAVRRLGALPFRVGAVGDTPREFSEALADQLVRADLVVTSGGVSKGAYDVVKEVLSAPDQKGSVWFGEVRMQPGKPQGVGVVGEDRTPILTLPGNPVSAYVSFEVFVAPVIRRLMGRTPYERPRRSARCTHPISSTVGRTQVVRAWLEHEPDGPVVSPVGGHGSHLVGDLAASNAFIVVEESVGEVRAGEQVQVMALDEEY